MVLNDGRGNVGGELGFFDVGCELYVECMG